MQSHLEFIVTDSTILMKMEYDSVSGRVIPYYEIDKHHRKYVSQDDINTARDIIKDTENLRFASLAVLCRHIQKNYGIHPKTREIT